MVTLPVTSRLPVINVLFCKLITPFAAVTFTTPVTLSIVLPLILILPVSISPGSIVVVYVPSVNVTPSTEVMLVLVPLNVISPVF